MAGIRLAAHQEKSPAARGPYRPDRRERPTDGPAAAPHLVAGGPDPGSSPRAAATARRSRSRRRCGCRPDGISLGLYFHTLADGYFNNWYVTAFLEAMLQDLAGRFVVVWDGGPMHKGDPIRASGGAIRRSSGLGAVAAVGPDAQPGGTALELVEMGAIEQLRAARRERTRRARRRRTGSEARRSGVSEEPVPCLGTSSPADITFLTLSSSVTK